MAVLDLQGMERPTEKKGGQTKGSRTSQGCGQTTVVSNVSLLLCPIFP